MIDIIKNTKYSVHQMQVSLEFYEKGVPAVSYTHLYVVVESKTPHNMKTIKPFEVKISENHPDKPQTLSLIHI